MDSLRQTGAGQSQEIVLSLELCNLVLGEGGTEGDNKLVPLGV